MAGNIRVQPEVLRAAGTALNGVGDKLDGVLKSLENELLNIGEPWGHDQIGQLIGEAYKEVVHWAFDILRELLNEINQSGVDLGKMADRYQQLEDELRRRFDEYVKSVGW